MAGDFSDITTALADAGTGAAAARAVEPLAGEGDGHTREGSCLNCGTGLIGPHCHACGQRAHVHRTLGAFFHDLLHGVLHFEGKTWRTLPLLVWQPGKLTREYIDGKRASYVSPIALFLFVVFFSFGLFNTLGDAANLEREIGTNPRDAVATVEQDLDQRIARLEQQRVDAASDAKDLTNIDRELAELRDSQAKLDTITATAAARSASSSGPAAEAVAGSLDAAWRQAKENPSLLIYKVQTNAYKYSWMLIPLSVPFVWLLFLFDRRFRGYDHTVFVTYSITFMIALVAISSLLVYAGAPSVGGLLLLYAPYHMYRQLRGAYGVTRYGGLWRMLALSLFAWVAIGLFAGLITWMAMGR